MRAEREAAATAARPADLAALRAALLRDRDGDGFPDALRGPVWISHGRGPHDVDAAVAAAAELLAPLADRALVLPIETRAWATVVPGFCIGPTDAPGDPEAAWPDATTSIDLPYGAELRWLDDGVVVTASDGPSLVEAVVTWLGDATGTRTEDRATPAAGTATTAARTERVGLGGLFTGNGDAGRTTYTGSPDHPERFVGGFAPTGGAHEALGVALRLALVGTNTPARVTAAPTEALVRTSLDAALPAGGWVLRVVHGVAGQRFELAGRDAAALGAGCTWFAHSFPRLPDGTRLDDVEHNLTQLVRGATRAGHLAAAAGAANALRRAGRRPVAAALPYPPAHAPRTLGLPVRNSARDGALRCWSTATAWEGDRLLEAAAGLIASAVPSTQRVTIEAFASETATVRASLRDRLVDLMAASRIDADVLPIRHAFRPALHWLVEEVAPAAPTGAALLRISVDRQPEAFGAADRWVRELYPVAELIEADRPDLRVEIELAPEASAEPTYTATFVAADGAVLGTVTLQPPVAESPHPGGGRALVTTAGVRLWRGDRAVATAAVPTDAAAFWTWFAGEVLPALVDGTESGDSPLVHEIAVVAELSEPDDLLPLDHETDSVLEALHEDVYFGVLEAVDSTLDAQVARHASPGRILPFFRQRSGGPMRATVVVRGRGSDRVAVRADDGAWHAALRCDADVHVIEVRGRDERIDGIVVDVAAPDATAADEALRRLSWAGGAAVGAWPTGIEVRAHRHGTATVDLAAVAAPPTPPRLPDRPLHPREAVAHARWWASLHASARFATPRETRLGQPLVVVEVTSPPHPAASRARSSAWKPTILLSARQHANEATSTPAAFAWLERWLDDPDLGDRANLVLHPLENPDGARLHAALRSLAPNHMHHAARYTAFGADLQTNPVVGGGTIAESLLRSDAAARWSPVLHLNDHGYPAHAWVRSQTGFLPRGFEDWSLPTGHLTIVSAHGSDGAEATKLLDGIAGSVERTLRGDPGVHDHTRAQVRRARRYRSAGQAPFTYRSELPFWLDHRPPRVQDEAAAATAGAGAGRAAPAVAPARLTPLLTLITEVPDETVSGEAWHRCVRAHVSVNDAVARGMLDWIEATAEPR
ncbi:MAG: M14 family zinc carboxypeptidase [Trueperaceae bacterium]|nr:M14 family zinc carboxypeptidase [Trueperaceae bacterium]